MNKININLLLYFFFFAFQIYAMEMDGYENRQKSMMQHLLTLHTGVNSKGPREIRSLTRVLYSSSWVNKNDLFSKAIEEKSGCEDSWRQIIEAKYSFIERNWLSPLFLTLKKDIYNSKEELLLNSEKNKVVDIGEKDTEASFTCGLANLLGQDLSQSEELDEDQIKEYFNKIKELLPKKIKEDQKEKDNNCFDEIIDDMQNEIEAIIKLKNNKDNNEDYPVPWWIESMCPEFKEHDEFLESDHGVMLEIF